MTTSFINEIFPGFQPDIWLQRYKNPKDWLGLGFITLLFVIVFYGELSALPNATAGTLNSLFLFFESYGILGFFLFIFGFVVAAITLGLESLGLPTSRSRFALNFVLYGKIRTIRAYAFWLMVGGIAGLAFALPNLLPINAKLQVAPSPTSPLEAILIAVLFAVLEELWRVSAFEPLLGNFMKGGAEFPLLLIVFGVISLFLPTFLSVAIIGVVLILAGITLAILFKLVPPIQYLFRTKWYIKDATVILVGSISWTLFHVYSASTLYDPYTLYLSALAFGLLMDILDRVAQSAIPSYTAHITNNAIVTVTQLGYSLYLAAFAIIVFVGSLSVPFLIGEKG